MMNEVDRTPLVTKTSELMLTHVQFTRAADAGPTVARLQAFQKLNRLADF